MIHEKQHLVRVKMLSITTERRSISGDARREVSVIGQPSDKALGELRRPSSLSCLFIKVN